MKRLATFVVAAVLAIALYCKWGPIASAVDQGIHGPYTVEQRVDEYGKAAAERLKPDFDRCGVVYPPSQFTLVILKGDQKVELYAPDAKGTQQLIKTYPILAASGHAGPKLREGDGQVPEGIYGVDSLNPNSHYHLALHVNYPNAFDRAHAKTDSRTQLGGDIMIHGSNVSIGCVAMGDRAAEELFVLSAKTGINNIRLLFCPFDFRIHALEIEPSLLPAWSHPLYDPLEAELLKLHLSPLTQPTPP